MNGVNQHGGTTNAYVFSTDYAMENYQYAKKESLQQTKKAILIIKKAQ